ncbi:hypothetical protein UMW_02788 [Enterococcus faecalis EnGen0295]|nr:hypothetical protein UMW_02788 [Enterococcus faecalis EnGen0295]VFA59361.1 Protein of uncharacterised function (DUF3847) [Enterococcus faecalis]
MSKKVLNLSLWKQADTKMEEQEMKKENTLQEVQEQISELQQEREKCDIKLKQLQNQGKKLEKLANEKERKRRNHRLIQRGLIVERVIENPLIFTNEEIEELLKVATDTEEYRQAYEEMINGKDMEDETIIE